MKTIKTKIYHVVFVIVLALVCVGFLNASFAQNEPEPAEQTQESVRVTADNYVRAETDFQMKDYIEKLDCFGKFIHSRKPYDVNNDINVIKKTCYFSAKAVA